MTQRETIINSPSELLVQDVKPAFVKPDTGAYENALYRYYVLAILTLVYAFNFIDRQLLVILQESIKADLGLSDTQLGLLTGFTFALFYVVCGIPIARWADGGTRRSIIALALTVWSVMTAISGLTQTYVHLLLARVGVGVGEAGGSPPAHSMISDIFAPAQRATALSIYSIGISLGILAGFLLGGWLSELFGWRMAFLVVGLPGILLALVVRFTVQEPERGWSQNQVSVSSAPPFGEVIQLLWSRRSFRHLALGAGLLGFVAYGLGNWLPSYFLRTFDLSMGVLGTWLALTAGIGGGAGTFLGGYLADRLGAKDKRWYLWLPALSVLIVVPVSAAILTLGNPSVALLSTGLLYLLFGIHLGPVLAIAHGLVGLRMRALSSAILFFVLNLIGMGLGPTLIGVLSDMLTMTGVQNSLRYALLLAGIVVSLWSCLHFLLAARTVRDDLANAPE